MRTATRRNIVYAGAPAFLVACLLLGGASAAGYLANLLLQLAALPLLIVAALRPSGASHTPAARQLTVLAALLVVLSLLQLVPLPPAVWSVLPGREPVAAGYELLGQPLPWLPLSLTPDRTLASLLWLLPAYAGLALVLYVGAFRSSWLAIALTGVALVSVAIGAAQLGGGSGSPAYLYAITNWGAAVGLFANANHLATLLLATIPFLAAGLASALERGRTSQRASAVTVVICATLCVVAVGLAISGSLAGIGLGVPVAGASFLLVWLRKRRLPRWAAPLLAIAAAAGLALVFAAPFGNNLTSASARGSSESRYTSFTKTLTAAQDYVPIGSGTGSFVDIYRQQEDPARVTRVFMNHAHSDPIEIWLENGVPGAILMVLLLLWWGRRTWALWQPGERDSYARAATIATGAILAHSLVDYPLRTAAISTLFAMCLALMAEARERPIQSRRETAARHVTA